jgi:hypothetical protein
MIQLSEQQVEFILNDIRRNGIEMEELQQNLLDHICCVIENEMPYNSNFEEFYRNILPRFFRQELREIQIETNLLLKFKNYYTMKKLLIYSGISSSIFLVFAAIFKAMHWPGANAMFLLGVIILSLLFLPLFLIIKTKESDKSLEKSVIIIGSVFGILVSLSTLFKILHWPYANMLWIVSISLLILLFIPVYYLNGIRREENKTNTIVSTVLILVAGILLFMLTNLKSSQKTEAAQLSANLHLNFQYINETAICDSKYLKLKADSNLKLFNLKLKADKACDAAEKIKKSIYAQLSSAFGGNPTYEDVLNNSKARDNYALTANILFDENTKPSKDLNELFNSLNEFRTLIKSEFGFDNNYILNTDEITEGKNWMETKFTDGNTEFILKNLTQIQLDVRFLQALYLN